MDDGEVEMSTTLCPSLNLLGNRLLERVVEEAFEILKKVGIQVQSKECLDLLASSGSSVYAQKHQAYIPRHLVEQALDSAPSSIKLYDRSCKLDTVLGGNRVNFMSLVGGTDVWDPSVGRVRPASTQDVVECIKVTNALKHITIQSASYYPNDVPAEVRGYFRNYLALKYGTKPTWGSVASSRDNIEITLALLKALCGSGKAFREKPLMVFPTSPISPLRWDEAGFYQLKEFILAGAPVAIIPAPTMGGTAPVTLVGTVTQCVAESLSGIVISQLLSPGSPVIMGCFPQVMDMRFGTTCASAMETFMGNMACVEVAKHFNLPRLSITGFCDAKRPDIQSGYEIGLGLLLSALSGANLVEGSGGLGGCMNGSLEQLVIANEVAGMVFRMLEGISARTERLAEDLFAETLFSGDHFLTSPVTMKWFKKEIHYPGKVVSREMVADWQATGCKTAEERAREEVARILATHEPEPLSPDVEKEMIRIVMDRARKHGVSSLPFMERE
jgi:trimethylamine--corrinoid protein Co-methyltransferase